MAMIKPSIVCLQIGAAVVTADSNSLHQIKINSVNPFYLTTSNKFFGSSKTLNSQVPKLPFAFTALTHSFAACHFALSCSVQTLNLLFPIRCQLLYGLFDSFSQVVSVCLSTTSLL